jgi:hypothetical protein
VGYGEKPLTLHVQGEVGRTQVLEAERAIASAQARLTAEAAAVVETQ